MSLVGHFNVSGFTIGTDKANGPLAAAWCNGSGRFASGSFRLFRDVFPDIGTVCNIAGRGPDRLLKYRQIASVYGFKDSLFVTAEPAEPGIPDDMVMRDKA